MKLLAVLAVALALAAPAAASSWHRVHVWTGHDISLTANRKLPAGTWRLVYSAKNPKTQMHVRLNCKNGPEAGNYKVTARPKTLTFRSSGCKMHVLMLGNVTLKASGMFMRLELDRR